MAAPQLAAVQSRIKSPFLEGLAPLEVETVLGAARECHFRHGAVIASQGTPANSVFLLVRGRARFFILTPDGHKILLMWLPVGEIIGGAAMQCRPSDYIVSTETVKDSTMLIWDRPTIRRLAVRYPQLVENALITAAEYLTFYVATHVALTCQSASQRLAAVLFNLAQGIGHKVPKGVELGVTNEELAEAANVTHFTASRLISQWHRQGALVKDARQDSAALSRKTLLRHTLSRNRPHPSTLHSTQRPAIPNLDGEARNVLAPPQSWTCARATTPSPKPASLVSG